MLFSPINNRQDFESLIHIGETPECIHWDYKSMLNSEEPINNAIDMAAFANTYGGTLLIGLSEKANDELNGLKVATGFAPKTNAESIKKQIYSNASNYLFPKIDVKVVPIKTSDGLVVAVNVEPSVDLVGVRTNNERGNFCFPYRTEYGNRYMSFEEVEKRMVDNKSRHIYLKLQKYVPNKGKVTIYPFPIGSGRAEWFVEWIPELENEVRLSQNGCRSIIVPLTYIDEVWKGNYDVCIKMNTRLFCGPDFIDFEDSAKVAIYRDAIKFHAEIQRNFRNGG